jgi:hypothetical protein
MGLHQSNKCADVNTIVLDFALFSGTFFADYGVELSGWPVAAGLCCLSPLRDVDSC